MSDKSKLLTEDEIKIILMASIAANGDKGTTEEDMLKAVRWAEGVRVDAGLLELVLAGSLFIRIEEDENNPSFITPEGLADMNEAKKNRAVN